MKIALVHEFLNQLGGAERVLQNFLEIWPEAVVHVLIYDPQKTGEVFGTSEKKISFLNSLPGVRRHHKLYLALMPAGVRSFDFTDYDLILSDSSSFAKGINAKGKLHICYCHTPTRFLWTEKEDYLAAQPYPAIFKLLGKPVLSWLRRWDYQAAQRPDYFIANSVNVQDRIKKYYHRDSVVIPPPVDTEFFSPDGTKKDYFFVASRLEPYKKIELVVEVFNELGLPLKVAGSGTTAGRLKTMAKTNIEFLGRVPDEKLRRYYSEALAFVFPPVEDAGIMPLEAQACGTPVIAFRAGGALETIKEGVTGEFFDFQTTESLKQVIKIFDPAKYKPQIIRQHALQYDKKNFQARIRQFVEEKFSKYQQP